MCLASHTLLLNSKSNLESMIGCIIGLLEWKTYQRKEDKYPIIKDFSLSLGLPLVLTLEYSYAQIFLYLHNLDVYLTISSFCRFLKNSRAEFLILNLKSLKSIF